MPSSLARFISNLFKIEENQKSLIMDGFEPDTVVYELSEPFFHKLIQLTISGKSGTYVSTVSPLVRDFITQILDEVCEGFYDGLDGIEKILKMRLKNYLSKNNREESEALHEIIWTTIWKKIKFIKVIQNTFPTI
jgi:hypothetical protein